MATPKSLVAHLHKHWEIIEELARISREHLIFDDDLLLKVVARFMPQTDDEERAGVVRSLLNADILLPLSRSTSVQLNVLILEFVRGLSKEHELGLSDVLKAKIEAIKRLTDQLAEALEDHDPDLMKRSAIQLSDLLRQITQQLEQDRHAILELAEQAKSSDVSIPIQKRYRAVLEAYDQYVEPMNEMMDSGLKGAFYPYIERAEKVLDKAMEVLSARGALYTQRLQLRQVAYQVKELRRLGRIVAQQCADILLPLRDEVRQHNELSSAISALLGQVRKKGLSRSLSSKLSNETFPVWRRERRIRISLGDEIRSIMAAAQDYEPAAEAFPESFEGPCEGMQDFIDENQLREQLKADLPIENLMTWLQHRHPTLSDPIILRLYHDLVRDPLWIAELSESQTMTRLRSVKVTYNPHRLTTPHEHVS